MISLPKSKRTPEQLYAMQEFGLQQARFVSDIYRPFLAGRLKKELDIAAINEDYGEHGAPVFREHYYKTKSDRHAPLVNNIATLTEERDVHVSGKLAYLRGLHILYARYVADASERNVPASSRSDFIKSIQPWYEETFAGIAAIARSDAKRDRVA